MDWTKITTCVAVGIAVMALGGCSDEGSDTRSLEDQQMEKLAGTWKVTSVKLDDVAKDNFEDFTIRITPVQGRERLSYIIDNNPYTTPWISVSTGFLLFNESDPEHSLVREDEVSIDYAVTNETLTLSFTYNEPGGRTMGVTGHWEFSFGKQ